jgi:hypothetical protein
MKTNRKLVPLQIKRLLIGHGIINISRKVPHLRDLELWLRRTGLARLRLDGFLYKAPGAKGSAWRIIYTLTEQTAKRESSTNIQYV